VSDAPRRVLAPSRGARRLFELIHKFIHRSGAFFASQAWIAKHLKTSIRSVKRWTAELVKGGYVSHSTGRQQSATYRILRDLPPKMAPHFPPDWHLIGTSLAPHIKEEPSVEPSVESFPSEKIFKSIPAPAVENAPERLACKNLKSKISSLVRSGNQMPRVRAPAVDPNLPAYITGAAGRDG
jgi:hypothetical protein